MSTPSLLEMRGITMDFPGVRALDSVDFTLRVGEVHCLMGENGAGKSTLIRVLNGIWRPTGGRMELAGAPLAPASPQHALRLGVSTVHQEVNLVPMLSVAENLFLGRMPWRRGLLRRGEMTRLARAALARLSLDVDPTRPLADFSIAIQQMVAIARALDVSARVLVLDEPTSSLDASEVQALFGVLRQLKKQGLGIILVTHFLGQVHEIGDRVTVLRNGRLVGTRETAGLSRLELVSMMIGRDAKELEQGGGQRDATATAGEVALEARGIGRAGSVRGCSLALRKGQVHGIAGLLGSGRTEVLRMLFGADRREEGEVLVQGKPAALRSPAQAIALGIGFCAEDRRSEGIIPGLSVRENMTLVLQGRRGWMRRLPLARQREIATRHIAALGIATSDMEKPISQLSGGNQQKVLLARWLAAEPSILLLDEPTRGIDVGARAEIEKLVESLRERGLGVVLVSSELEELARLCQQVTVLRDRRVAGTLEGGQVSEQGILRSIAGEAA